MRLSEFRSIDPFLSRVWLPPPPLWRFHRSRWCKADKAWLKLKITRSQLVHPYRVTFRGRWIGCLIGYLIEFDRLFQDVFTSFPRNLMTRHTCTSHTYHTKHGKQVFSNRAFHLQHKTNRLGQVSQEAICSHSFSLFVLHRSRDHVEVTSDWFRATSHPGKTDIYLLSLCSDQYFMLLISSKLLGSEPFHHILLMVSWSLLSHLRRIPGRTRELHFLSPISRNIRPKIPLP